MSYLAFTSREREVHVRGWERHRLPGICQDMAWGLMGATAASPSAQRLGELMNPAHVRHFTACRPMTNDWINVYRLFFMNGDDLIKYKDHVVSSTDLVLNTVLALGSGPMKLAARFAGQSYSHCWIPEHDRKWAADLIEAGLLTDVFRHKIRVTNPPPFLPDASVQTDHHTGWTDVMELLRETDRGPVVLSVSTGDDFPSASDLGVPDGDWEEFQENSNDQVWDLAEVWLANRHRGHMIAKSEFGEYRFGHRLTVWDVLATDYEDRLDRAITEKRI